MDAPVITDPIKETVYRVTTGYNLGCWHTDTDTNTDTRYRYRIQIGHYRPFIFDDFAVKKKRF